MTCQCSDKVKICLLLPFCLFGKAYILNAVPGPDDDLGEDLVTILPYFLSSSWVKLSDKYKVIIICTPPDMFPITWGSQALPSLREDQSTELSATPWLSRIHLNFIFIRTKDTWDASVKSTSFSTKSHSKGKKKYNACFLTIRNALKCFTVSETLTEM